MITREFITAGRAILTVSNNNGQYYTYRIKMKDADAAYLTPCYFVSLLTGPNNMADYTYLGILDPATGVVRLTRASHYNNDSLPVKVINWAMAMVYGDHTLPPGYAIQHANRCGCCARRLTTPESIEIGIGPECRERMGMHV